MTAVFVDTSAIFAALVVHDLVHEVAADGWRRLIAAQRDGSVRSVTHSGVLIESATLLQRREGVEAVRSLNELLLPVEVEWIGPELHSRATAALLASGQRAVSLVDWTSFELMRADGIRTAFAFDDDFERQGFTLW